MNEPKITINGQTLSDAEAMTVRVAVEAFAAELDAKINSLGADRSGMNIRAGYIRSINLIREKIFAAPVADNGQVP